MNESTELENRPSTSRDNTNEITNKNTNDNTSKSNNDNTSRDEFDERCPLLFTVDNPPRRNCLTKDHICVACLSAFVVVAVGIATYLLIVEGRQEVPDKLLVMTKDSWIARESPLNISKRIPPAQRVLLLQTNTKRCWSESECIAELRNIQKDHIEFLDEPEIMYNFMIGNDERIYEGRGWQYLSSYEDSAEDLLTVAFLGYYGKVSPTQQQTTALETLLNFGVYSDYLIPCYKIVVAKSSPRGLMDVADQLEEKLKKQKKC